MTEIFLARQPVFDEKEQLAAYDLHYSGTQQDARINGGVTPAVDRLILEA